MTRLLCALLCPARVVRAGYGLPLVGHRSWRPETRRMVVVAWPGVA